MRLQGQGERQKIAVDASPKQGSSRVHVREREPDGDGEDAAPGKLETEDREDRPRAGTGGGATRGDEATEAQIPTSWTRLWNQNPARAAARHVVRYRGTAVELSRT